MTIDPAVLIAAIAALAGLLIGVFRLFLTGALMSRTVVPREDYEKVLTINAGYADQFGQQSDAVKVLSAIVDKKLVPRRPVRAR